MSSLLYVCFLALALSFRIQPRLVIIQMFLANILVCLVRYHDLRLPSWADFFRWLPVSFLISGMLGTSIFALEGTTVSTASQLSLRRL